MLTLNNHKVSLTVVKFILANFTYFSCCLLSCLYHKIIFNILSFLVSGNESQHNGVFSGIFYLIKYQYLSTQTDTSISVHVHRPLHFKSRTIFTIKNIWPYTFLTAHSSYRSLKNCCLFNFDWLKSIIS